MSRFGTALTLLFAVAVSACAGVPDLDIRPPAAANEKSETALILNEVVCEIMGTGANFSTLQENKYFIVVQLLRKAEDSTGLTPSLNFIDPLDIAGTSQTAVIGGEITNGRLRQFNLNFVIEASELKAESCDQAGRNASAGGLSGNIGLADVIAAGLDSKLQPPGVLYATLDGKNYSKSPVFGSTVQFTLKRAINGGPTWTKVNFKGPNGANGLVNTGRTETNQLQIAFSPIPVPKGDKSLMTMIEIDANKFAALREAQQLIQQMTLQNLNIAD